MKVNAEATCSLQQGDQQVVLVGEIHLRIQYDSMLIQIRWN